MVVPTLEIETDLWNQGFNLVCGLDEVGRGCFAGPVVVGAVIFDKSCKIPEGIRDSKLLKADKRKKLSELIKECCLAWSIGISTVEVINQLGIGKATQIAFLQAVEALKVKPDFLVIDAFYIDNIEKSKQKPIVHGDGVCISIAAASIIAKVYRDELMEQLDDHYPGYNFAKHKGYGTKEHRDAIKQKGLCEIHRTSFNLHKFL